MDIHKKVSTYGKVSIFYILLGAFMLLIPAIFLVLHILNPNQIIAHELLQGEMLKIDQRIADAIQDLNKMVPSTELEKTLIDSNIFYIQGMGTIGKLSIMYVSSIILTLLAVFGGVILGVSISLRKLVVLVKPIIKKD